MGYRLESPEKKGGISAQTIRFVGLIALLVGVIGQCIIQNRLLGVNTSTGKELYAALADSENMKLATAGIVASLIQTCAVPVFSFLLVEGLKHTKSLKKYFARVAGLAVLSELPYNLAFSGKLIDFNSRNPVVGLALAMVMVYLLRQYGGNNLKGLLITAMVMIVGIFWVEMLRIADGAPVIVMVCTLWLSRKKLGLQVFFGCVVMFLCMVFSPLYFAAPMVFLMIHFYNGEPGESNRWINYLAYPAMLLCAWVFATFGI